MQRGACRQKKSMWTVLEIKDEENLQFQQQHLLTDCPIDHIDLFQHFIS